MAQPIKDNWQVKTEMEIKLSSLDYVTELDYCLDKSIRKESCVKLFNDPYSKCLRFTFDLADTVSVTLFPNVLPDLAS